MATPHIGGSTHATHHPIHAALYRPVLFLGVEQPVAILEATLVFALVVGVGFHLMTIAVAAMIISVIHPTMTWITAHDAEITRVYLRSIGSQDYYPAHSALTARVLSVRPSIPTIR
ncbi:MAG TPA: VirB3 family type IV secretion system protein [Gemmatimonadaceae bacterium]|jgi:type IV secretory pathway TrbD component|nr:VirB3 family type IV secretion system protein [Gemmatimonadaceae bacterium]